HAAGPHLLQDLEPLADDIRELHDPDLQASRRSGRGSSCVFGGGARGSGQRRGAARRGAVSASGCAGAVAVSAVRRAPRAGRDAPNVCMTSWALKLRRTRVAKSPRSEVVREWFVAASTLRSLLCLSGSS